MYIKQIIIEGFKSYKYRTIIEPFDKRHNVVVGRNGSGKSNFFFAIQFVLGDAFKNLSSEQRLQLIHQGTGDGIMTAYVEIIFDNKDHRLSIEKDEIFLRRVISAKKDQYFLDKRLASHSEIVHVLESAGLCKAEMLFIVKQGQINQIAVATDAHRLKLLLDVAGTRAYDARKDESLKILRETQCKVVYISEMLQKMEDQLNILGEEKEELQEYIKLDKIRRTFEYLIFNTELKSARKKLDDLDNQLMSFSDLKKQFDLDIQVIQEMKRGFQKNMQVTEKEVVAAKNEQSILTHEQQNLLLEKTKLDLTMADLIEEIQNESKFKEQSEHELILLKATIEKKTRELNDVLPTYNALCSNERECSRELTLKQQKRKELFAKQGRHFQFSSQRDRDKWIHNELDLLSQQIEGKLVHRNKLMDDVKNFAVKQKELEVKILEITTRLEQLTGDIEELKKQYYELKKEKDHHMAARDELWRKETQITQTLTSHKEQLDMVELCLRLSIGKPILNGSQSVRKVLESFANCNGPNSAIAKAYYGQVIELLKCPKDLYIAVEVTASDRLFHHIVESDEVGTQILKEMNNLKLPGEAYFLPLNRLQMKIQHYPDGPDTFPMISKLKYEVKYDKAMRKIFGNTMVCRNLEIAVELARGTELDYITLDGYKVSSNGCFTGGYFDEDRSRLTIYNRHREFKKIIKQIEIELNDLRNDLKTSESNVKNITSKMEETETNQRKAKNIFYKMQGDFRLMKEDITRIEKFRIPKKKSVTECNLNLEEMNNKEAALKTELQQEIISQLSSQEQHTVDQLNDDIRRLKKESKEAFDALMTLEAKKTRLENWLTSNLFRRRDELMLTLQENPVEDRKLSLQVYQTELVETEKKILRIMNELQVADKKVEDATKCQIVIQKKLDTCSQKEKVAEEKITEESKKFENDTSKENLLRQIIDKCTEKIATLGALPQIESCYTKMSLKNLVKKFEETKIQLQKYNHVNKKALINFISIPEQKTMLFKRKEELDTSDQEIRELLQSIETQKVGAVQSTFHQIAENFTTIFKKLVPQGYGRLMLETKNNNNSKFKGKIANADDFTGLGIRVSFLSGTEGEMNEMKQLSGGQKSLVALALIFAIQKYEPAPFYLFDEIDQALDIQHRMVVADMIYDLSEKAQFITTTFRPELLEHAHKFYGVRVHNKVSRIDCVTKEEARDFVADDHIFG